MRGKLGLARPQIYFWPLALGRKGGLPDQRQSWWIILQIAELVLQSCCISARRFDQMESYHLILKGHVWGTCSFVSSLGLQLVFEYEIYSYILFGIEGFESSGIFGIYEFNGLVQSIYSTSLRFVCLFVCLKDTT